MQRFVLNNTVQHCNEELVNLNNENYNKKFQYLGIIDTGSSTVVILGMCF